MLNQPNKPEDLPVVLTGWYSAVCGIARCWQA